MKVFQPNNYADQRIFIELVKQAAGDFSIILEMPGCDKLYDAHIRPHLDGNATFDLLYWGPNPNLYHPLEDEQVQNELWEAFLEFGSELKK